VLNPSLPVGYDGHTEFTVVRIVHKSPGGRFYAEGNAGESFRLSQLHLAANHR
jgi:hypothetical protein